VFIVNEWFTVYQLQHHNVVPVVDVVFLADYGVTSLGLCFCDTDGQFVAGSTQRQHCLYSIVEGEA
jgi:hypothetical protein